MDICAAISHDENICQRLTHFRMNKSDEKRMKFAPALEGYNSGSAGLISLVNKRIVDLIFTNILTKFGVE